MAEVTLHKTLQGHTSEVNSVAFSSDNKLIAPTSDDDTVRLRDGSNGNLNDVSIYSSMSVDESIPPTPIFIRQGRMAFENKTLLSELQLEREKVKTANQMIERLKEENNQMSDAYAIFENKSGDELRELRAKVVSLNAKLNDNASSLTHIENELNTANQKNQELQQENKRLKNEISERKDLKELQKERAEITADNDKLKQHITAKQALELQLKTKTEAQKKVEEEKAVLERQLKELKVLMEAKLDELSEQLLREQIEKNVLQQQLDDARQDSHIVDMSKQLQQLDGQAETVNSIAFSSDGKLIASVSHNETVRLRNAPLLLQSKMEAEQQEINVDSLRECVCCQEIKDSTYLLPCLHAACSQCVADFVKEAKSCCCACGENFVQDKLTTVPSTTLLTPTCSFDCDEAVTTYCVECKKYMCQIHSDGHRVSKSTKAHVVQLVAEVPFCQKHSTETALGFCTHCEVLVCGKCIVNEHNKPPHLSITLQEAAKTTTDAVKNDVAKLLEFVPSINKEIQKYKNIRTKLEKERSELEDKIADVRSQEKVTTLQIEDLENTKALLLTTQKQANTLAATATTLPHSTLVRLQSVVTNRVKQLQTGLDMISGFFH